MRGHDLREILADIRNAVGSTGGTKYAEAIAATEAAIAPQDNVQLEQLIANVDAAVASLTKPAWQCRLDELREAGLAEQAFLRALDDLRNDHAIKKPDLLKIAESYVGYVEKKLSTDRLLDAIKTRFYGKLYDYDANEMAKRATPW
jgi:glycerol-3-phosphate O-acyltransferase